MRFFLYTMIYSIFLKANIKNSIALLILQKENSKIIHLKKLGFAKISCNNKFCNHLNLLGATTPA